MKRFMVFIFASICVLNLVGCQKTIRGSELYSFPEPTMQITATFYSQGQETVYEIGSENYDPDDLSVIPLISWFYDLELTACDKPEAAEGAESYTFQVDEKEAFTYEERGSEAYLIMDNNCYRVNNPSTPPLG